jgi:hypothetical protein
MCEKAVTFPATRPSSRAGLIASGCVRAFAPTHRTAAHSPKALDLARAVLEDAAIRELELCWTRARGSRHEIFFSFESTPVLLKTKTSEVGQSFGWSVPVHCFK